MSDRVVNLVVTRVLGGAVRKFVMRTLAAYASDDGAGVYASFATIADECELDRKTVKRVLQAFEAEGLVRKVGMRECRNGKTNDYALDLSAIAALPETGGTAPRVTAHRGHSAPGAESPDRGHSAPPTGGTAPPKSIEIISTTGEASPLRDTPPSLRSGGARTPARKRVASDQTLPAAMTDAMTAYAADSGFVNGRAENLFAAWRDHHISRATPIADADASFRTWVRNEIKFHGRPAHVPSAAIEQPRLFGIAAQNAAFNERSNRGALAALRNLGGVGQGADEGPLADEVDPRSHPGRRLGHS